MRAAKKKHATEIPLYQDSAGRLLPYVVAFMVFIAMVALIGGVLLGNVSQVWQDGLAGRLTVILPARLSEASDVPEPVPEAHLQELATRIEALPFVRSARPLQLQETRRLLEPWLGASSAVEGLPLPGFIDVQLRRSGTDTARSMTGQLREALGTLNERAVLDDHNVWRERLSRITLILRYVAWATIVIVGVTASVIVSFATRSAMSTHHATIEILNILGAPDVFVIRQFRRWAFFVGLQGLFVGLLGLSILFVFILAYGGWQLGLWFLQDGVRFFEFLYFLLPPLLSLVLVMSTSVLTVRKKLRQML